MATTQMRRNQVLSQTLKDTEVASANIDGSAGVASLRTIGTGALQAASGADGRFNAAGVAQGDLSYGNAAPAWARLAAGTANQVLKTGGAGANPAWANADWHLLSSTTLGSAVASVAFTLPSGFFSYRLDIANMAPANNAVFMIMRTSTNGGSSYDAGASDYGFQVVQGTLNVTTAAAAQVTVAGSNITLGNATNRSLSGEMKLWLPSSTTQFAKFAWQTTEMGSDGQVRNTVGAGQRLTAADVDAFQLLYSVGNIAAGAQFRLYGCGV